MTAHSSPTPDTDAVDPWTEADQLYFKDSIEEAMTLAYQYLCKAGLLRDVQRQPPIVVVDSSHTAGDIDVTCVAARDLRVSDLVPRRSAFEIGADGDVRAGTRVIVECFASGVTLTAAEVRQASEGFDAFAGAGQGDRLVLMIHDGSMEQFPDETVAAMEEEGWTVVGATNKAIYGWKSKMKSKDYFSGLMLMMQENGKKIKEVQRLIKECKAEFGGQSDELIETSTQISRHKELHSESEDLKGRIQDAQTANNELQEKRDLCIDDRADLVECIDLRQRTKSPLHALSEERVSPVENKTEQLHQASMAQDWSVSVESAAKDTPQRSKRPRGTNRCFGIEGGVHCFLGIARCLLLVGHERDVCRPDTLAHISSPAFPSLSSFHR